MQLKMSGWVLAIALGATASLGQPLHAQCDGPVVVQVPKEASSIAEAVAMACPGHPLEIVLAEGTWPMAIDTQDPSIEITIRGVSKTGSVVTETEAGVPLNTITGSRVVLRQVTVADLSPGPLHSWILFDDCIVRDVDGGFRVPMPDLVVARDTVFERCTRHAWGVLYLEGSTVVNCTFIDCRRPIIAWGGPGSTNVITACSFVGTSDYAVRAINNSAIAGCSFVSSKSVAIDAGQSTPRVFSVADCVFDAHASAAPGGAIRDIAGNGPVANTWNITNCTFTNNSAPSGGAMYFGIDRSVTLTNCVFEGNVATMSHGGAFAHEGGGYTNVLSASDCQFVGNSAPSGAGGAVFTVGWGGVNTLIRCHFEGNSASIGGAYRTDRHVVSIDDCSFSGNEATGADSGRGGGAIAMEAISQATIVGSTFSGNNANRGGAIDHYWYCAGVSVSSCTFTGNSGVLSGGAIVARDHCAIEVMSCHFDGNTAPIGAAVYASGSTSDGDAVHVTSTRFIHHAEAVSDASILGGSGLAIVSESNVFCDNAIPAAVGDVDFDASNCVVEFCTDANGDGEVDACACPGDLNGDFVTDGADLSIVLGYWGKVTNPNSPGDLNDDGLVDGADLAVMLGGWGDCP